MTSLLANSRGQAAPGAASPTPRRRRGGPGRAARIAGMLFVLPATAYIVVFHLFPVLYGLYLSFTSYSPLDRGSPQLIGLNNYRGLLDSSEFLQSLRVTAQFVAEALPLAIGGALALALLANRRIRGIAFFRTAMFMPRVIALSAVSLIWLWMYSRYGFFNWILETVGLPGQDWLLQESTALHAVVLMRVWKALGANMVLLLAGLQNIPAVLYEAAEIDGAGAWAKFRHVTLPGLRPMLTYVIVIDIVGLSQSFAEIYILTGGGPLRSTTTTNFLIYQEAFQYNQMGEASAMAFVLFAFIFGFAMLALRARRES